MIAVSGAWKNSYPGAVIGVLVMRGVQNPAESRALQERKRQVEEELRTRFSGKSTAELRSLDEVQPYVAYYKRYSKSYHVLLQLESVALKGKPIVSVAALVEAMFLAELEDLLLTAGHDLAAVRTPVRVDVATGRERFTKLNGQEQQLKAGDMVMIDGEGVIASVLDGPDQRTRITPGTREVMFVTYAPPGIGEEAVTSHLKTIQGNVLLVTPEAETELLRTYSADR